MSLYRVYFKWKEKEISLTARLLDLTHPYFVSIKDLVFPTKPKLIIDPLEDEVRRTFGSSLNLMIPFQTVILIEETSETETRIMPFPHGAEDKQPPEMPTNDQPSAPTRGRREKKRES